MNTVPAEKIEEIENNCAEVLISRRHEIQKEFEEARLKYGDVILSCRWDTESGRVRIRYVKTDFYLRMLTECNEEKVANHIRNSRKGPNWLTGIPAHFTLLRHSSCYEFFAIFPLDKMCPIHGNN